MKKLLSILLFTLLFSTCSFAVDLVYNWDMDDGFANWSHNNWGEWYTGEDADGTTHVTWGLPDQSPNNQGIWQNTTKINYAPDTIYTMTVRARNNYLGGIDGINLNFGNVTGWIIDRQDFQYAEWNDPTPDDPNDPYPWEIFTATLDPNSALEGEPLRVNVSIYDSTFGLEEGYITVDYVSVLPDRPVFTVQPISTYADPDAEFSVEVACSDPVTYYWYISDDNQVDTGDTLLASGTSDSIIIESVPVSDDGKYVYCIAENDNNTSLSTDSEPARMWIPGLVAHWKFDGDLTDSSGNGWTGSCPDPTFVTGAGIDGDAIEFVRDVNDANRVTIPGSETAFNFYDVGLTVNAWCKSPDAATGGWAGIVTKQPDPNEGWWLGNWPGTPSMNMRTVGSVFADNSVTDGQWHMITGTYDGSTGEIAVYVDGELAASTISSSSAVMTDLPVVIGAATADGGSPYGGLVDDVRIYNYAKNQYDVLDLYNELVEPDKNLCFEQDQPAWDFTGPAGEPDCIVDFYDFTALADGWMTTGLYPAP